MDLGMGDEEETAADVAKKLQVFFANRKADNPCPFCGNSIWVSIWPEKRDATRGGAKAYSLFCTQCGFVRTHLAAVVNDEDGFIGDSGSYHAGDS